MLLCIDIGNTNIKCAIINDDTIIAKTRLGTDPSKTSDEYLVNLYTLLAISKLNSHDITDAIISSVVPKLTSTFEKTIQSLFNIDSLIIGPGIKTGLNILLDDPATLGSDLVAACVAVINLYSSPAIMISLGTASVSCVIDKNKNMRGGLISPGIEISLEGLTNKSALLPSIDLRAPKSVIGKNTIDCMKSGIVLGEACKIDGLIDKIEEELDEKCTVIATGGLSKSIIPNCTHDIIIDEDLIIKGLQIIYNKNK